ncbi:hypothetical protein APR04_003794 [Promicromonospora umidemergens]|nr:hypothetical protein [Promicromonospora umidemergens]
MRGATLRLVRYLPGVLGALLVVTGAALVYIPAGLLVAGVLLLLLDRRI